MPFFIFYTRYFVSWLQIIPKFRKYWFAFDFLSHELCSYSQVIDFQKDMGRVGESGQIWIFALIEITLSVY